MRVIKINSNKYYHRSRATRGLPHQCVCVCVLYVCTEEDYFRYIYNCELNARQYIVGVAILLHRIANEIDLRSGDGFNYKLSKQRGAMDGRNLSRDGHA